MIYDSPEALKKAFEECYENWLLPMERQDVNQEFFMPDRGTFEAVRGNDGTVRLVPADLFYSYLFRGQVRDFNPSLPTIYRKTSDGRNPDELDIFIDRMRVEVFARLIESHPVVRGFFLPHNFHVDYTGLAQHYGLRTDMMDLTVDLDVALFFAMCPYDRITDSYGFFSDNETHIGYLYVIMPMFDEPDPVRMFRKFTPVGLQVFERPGRQKAFACRIGPGEEFVSRRYTFRYTSKDSEAAYRMYYDGEYLWCRDILADKAGEIVSMTEFPYKIFQDTFLKSRPSGYSRTRLKDALASCRNVTVSSKTGLMQFSSEEKRIFEEKWISSQGKEMKRLITRRRWGYSVVEDGVSRVRYPIRPFVTYDELAEISALRSIMAADNILPEGAEMSGVRKVRGGKRDSGWRKVPGKFIDARASAFLSDRDMVLRK